MPGKIVIRGARVHNLKGIDLEIPRDQFVVITGVSGSGKSSLAFDTLYAEGQRRYVESLSTEARQFLQQVGRPDVEAVEGLSPAIAIQQKTGTFGPRSTVGTVTEIYDFLRLLFARVGEPSCPHCGREVSAHTIGQMVDQLMAFPAGTRIHVMAPLGLTPATAYRELLDELAREGFARARINGRMVELSDLGELEPSPPAKLDLVIDRLALRAGVEGRLADSLELAGRYGRQMIKVEVLSDGENEAFEKTFSQNFTCVGCGRALPGITPGLFSFNSPEGACPACGGLGTLQSSRHLRLVEDRSIVKICDVCDGSRLKQESLAVRIGGKSIAQVASWHVADAIKFFEQLKFSDHASVIGTKIVPDIVDRLRFLDEVGLNYLSLDRASDTLSGGEAQRVRLATQIGSGLSGVLYILDEPSIGLHQKDNARLLGRLRQLRDLGNSVVVVEHDPETILAADYLVELGPGAGEYGGEVVAQGTPAELVKDARSLTGQYLSGRLHIPMLRKRRQGTGQFLVVTGAKHHNLAGVTVQFPIGAMTCVTGVSGSGKSSLVLDIVYRAVAQRLQRFQGKVGRFNELLGWEHFDRVIGVDQGSIGRTPRSNPATYTGFYDRIRELFAQVPDARVRGYQPARFSFNVSGGRCEACHGEGVVKVDMFFLPDIYVTCATCKGRRYNRETLQVKYKGLNIADVLDLTVGQALEIFANVPAVAEKLRLLNEVGLGYLRLGQPGQTLSGGEAQRIKLAKELGRRDTGRSLYIFDEPTTGLHLADVQKLLDLLHRLTDTGNTLIIIEHNLEIIKSADYIIDLGPEGGDRGGRIVAHGPPEKVARSRASYTGQYLAQALSGPEVNRLSS
jgi:excinuclease ABC subunit A